MAKAYWIATYRSIADPDAQASYGKLAFAAIQAAGGRFLARGLPSATKELGMMERTVLVAFDSVEQALAAYDSPAYREARAVLGEDNAQRDIRIIEALE
jgi:uncharacterized protein (DUF1330 family)